MVSRPRLARSARAPQCAGAAVEAVAGAICCGGAVAGRAGGRGGACTTRRGGAGGGGGAVAVAVFGSGDVPGSAVMMLTAGIEAADGKSYFDGTGTGAGTVGPAAVV
jgi:hypothetical protein